MSVILQHTFPLNLNEVSADTVLQLVCLPDHRGNNQYDEKHKEEEDYQKNSHHGVGSRHALLLKDIDKRIQYIAQYKAYDKGEKHLSDSVQYETANRSKNPIEPVGKLESLYL